MDAVQVEPVVPTIGLTAGTDAEISAGIKVSASCTLLIWVAYSGYKKYPMTPHTLGLWVSLYGGTPFLPPIPGV